MIKITSRSFWYLLFAVSLWFLFYFPIRDVDYWWHIALGREMLDQWSIFQVDPFNIYSATDSIRSETVLQGQWFGQVLLYLGHSWLGDMGAQIIRWLVVLGTTFVFYLRLRNQGLKQGEYTFALMLGLAFLVHLLQGYSGERPQLFSILFMSLGMFVTEAISRDDKIPILLTGCLLLLVVVWANTHGAFLLFIAIFGLVGCSRVLFSESVLRKQNTYKWLLLVTTVVLATLLSPNGLQTYLYLLDLEGSELQQRTSEYVSILQLFRMSSMVPAIVFSLYAIASIAASGILFRDKKFQNGFVVLVLILIGLSAYRYFVFSVVVTLPIVLPIMCRMVMSLTRGRIIGQILGVMAMSSLILLSVQNVVNMRSYFPENGWRVLEEQNVQGVVFNTVNIGGYLLWHGYPAIRPFIDGRILDTDILAPYTNALWLTEYGKQWFDQQQFEAVFMSSENRFTHEPYPLVSYLKQTSEWKLIYEKNNWIGFVKK